MTLYVDDMTFSSSKKPNQWYLDTITGILKRYGLSANMSKTKISYPHDDKEATGVKITPRGEMLPPDKLLTKLELEKSLPEETRNPKRLAGLQTSINRIMFPKSSVGGTITPSRRCKQSTEKMLKIS